MDNIFNLNLEEAKRLFIQSYLENSVVKNREPQMTDLFFAPGHPLRSGRLPQSSFYCGITDNLERRMREHNAKELTYVISKDVNAAISLETELGNWGFDIGGKPGNGARADSVCVYMYKKIPNITKEHIS